MLESEYTAAAGGVQALVVTRQGRRIRTAAVRLGRSVALAEAWMENLQPAVGF